MVINKMTGRGCAWCIASRAVVQRLVDEGIVNKIIAKKSYYKSYVLLQVKLGPRGELYIDFKKGGMGPEEPLWAPSFIDGKLWQQATRNFSLQGGLEENIVEHLFPEMTDYLQTIPDAALVSMTREFLLEHELCNKPLKQYKGVTYYFNEDEIYSRDKANLFPIRGRIKSLFTITGAGASFFNNSVWRKAVTQFEVGMTLCECIEIFLKTEIVHHAPPELTPVDRLVQCIMQPVYERVPGNHNEATFDRIRITVGLPRYQFDSWEALQKEVKKYRREIIQRVVEKLEGSTQFKGYGVPINFLKLSNITLLHNFALEFIFELKGQSLEDTERQGSGG